MQKKSIIAAILMTVVLVCVGCGKKESIEREVDRIFSCVELSKEEQEIFIQNLNFENEEDLYKILSENESYGLQLAYAELEDEGIAEMLLKYPNLHVDAFLKLIENDNFKNKNYYKPRNNMFLKAATIKLTQDDQAKILELSIKKRLPILQEALLARKDLTFDIMIDMYESNERLIWILDNDSPIVIKKYSNQINKFELNGEEQNKIIQLGNVSITENMKQELHRREIEAIY